MHFRSGHANLAYRPKRHIITPCIYRQPLPLLPILSPRPFSRKTYPAMAVVEMQDKNKKNTFPSRHISVIPLGLCVYTTQSKGAGSTFLAFNIILSLSKRTGANIVVNWHKRILQTACQPFWAFFRVRGVRYHMWRLKSAPISQRRVGGLLATVSRMSMKLSAIKQIQMLWARQKSLKVSHDVIRMGLNTIWMFLEMYISFDSRL